MQKIPTDELNALLEKVDPDQLDAYLKSSKKYMINDPREFSFYVKDLLNEKRVKLKDLYLLAGVSESYGSKILSMEKHTKDRNLILRICLAGKFSLEETNRALKLYGMSELYAKDPRDACLIVAIHHRIYDLLQIDDILEKRGFQKISAEENE